jgi:hypothetical protein
VLPPSIPNLSFDQVRARLAAELAPGANVPPKWRPNGPLSDVYGLGHLFTSRLAKAPVAPAVPVPAHGKVSVRAGSVFTPAYPGAPAGAGGALGPKAALLTPLHLARAMQRYVQNRKSNRKGWTAGKKRLTTNLRRFLSTVCQNRRGGQCSARKTNWVGGWPVYPTFFRDINGGCVSSLAAIFDIFYGAIGPYPATTYTAANSRLIARDAARRLTVARGKVPAAGKAGAWIYPASACPCLDTPLECKAVAECAWAMSVPGVSAAGCAPALLFPAHAAGVPSPAEGFPGIEHLAGERYPAKSPAARRAKSSFSLQGPQGLPYGAKTVWWRRPAPAGGYPPVDL